MTTFRRKFAPVLNPVFRSYWRLSRSMTLGARVLAVDAVGRVLLVRPTYRNHWELPGGGVESLETAEEAARRELAEEGGVLAEGPLSLFGLYANHRSFKNDHVVLFQTNSFSPCPPDSKGEIEARDFFTPDNLPSDVSPGTRRRIAELVSGGPRAAHW